MISLWWTIGPAISCGKKLTNRAKSTMPYGFGRSRQVSTRKAIFWKVMNEMPRGRMMCSAENSRPVTRSRFSRKKFVYLKKQSTARLAATPMPRSQRRVGSA